jgi:hypothetical protein
LCIIQVDDDDDDDDGVGATPEYISTVGSTSCHYDPKSDVILRLEHIVPRDFKVSLSIFTLL